MGLKKRKPTTPSQRFTTLSDFDSVSKARPERRLTAPLKSRAGRANSGRISVRHRGSGHKRRYRRIDFRRSKRGVTARVAAIEYDPNRSARIALLFYADGEKSYILAPAGLTAGSTVEAGPDAEPRIGNSLPLGRIPLGMPIHNIELAPGCGGQLVRSAGGTAQVMAREGSWATVRLPSGEIRMIDVRCYATIGQVGNIEHESRSLGKAGRNRWLGRRPTVRGVVMNPVDHPMGGGEGRTSGGGPPSSPWGVPSKGKKTRRRGKASNRFIVQRRKK